MTAPRRKGSDPTMKNMKLTANIAAAFMALLTSTAAFGQTNLQFTSIVQTPEQSIQIAWTSTNGEVYQIQYANALGTNADGHRMANAL